jgi:DNA-binding NarL/FixJ family response regulator
VQVGEVLFVIALNCIVIFTLYRLQQKSLEKRIKHLKKEIQDLEDLVAAIIEEFEEIAEATDVKATDIKNAILESATIIESNQDSKEATADYYNQNAEVSDRETVLEAPNLPDTSIPTITPYLASESELEVESVPASKNSRPVNDPRHQQILDLWEQGVSIGEIARKLGTGRGEVQLILGIYRRS